jgi:hypothetical protein
MALFCLACAACATLLACGRHAAQPTDGGVGPAGRDASADGEGAAGDCPRVAPTSDGVRRVVVSHPFDQSGDKDKRFEVLELSAAGVLSTTGKTFTMGNFFDGTMAMTPDGALGFVAQDDGTIGEFRLGADGTPTVLAAGYKGGFYAERVVMDPAGDRVYVLDSEWRENGGGVYSLKIACDGSFTDEGRWVPAKLPYQLLFLPRPPGGPAGPGAPTRALLASADVLSSMGSADTYLIGWSATPELLGQASGFGSADAIIAAGALSPDGKLALFADHGMFSSTAGTVAVLRIDGDSLAPLQLLGKLQEPTAIVVSPYNNAALVVLTNTFDAVIALGYDASAATPFTVKGPISYQGKRPALPGGSVLIERGALRGRVLIAENEGVRQVAFNADGTISDLGLFTVGTDVAGSVGGIGVQP